MKLAALRLILTQADLAAMLARVPMPLSINGLTVAIEPDAVVIRGTYQMLVPVGFESRWIPSAANGKAHAQLSDFRAMGLPASILRGKVLGEIRGAVSGPVSVVGDSVAVDLAAILGRYLPLEVYLRSIVIQSGELVLEA